MVKSKWFSIFMAVGLVLLAAFSFKAAKDAGAFRKYPKPAYLSDEESALRPVYQELSRKEQAVYEALYRGIINGKEHITLPYEVPEETYSRLFRIIEKEEFGFFHLDSKYYTADKVRDAHVIYRVDGEKRESMKKELEDGITSGLSGIAYNTDEYEKVMRIHDYIVRNCKYVESDSTGFCSTAYGCLVMKEANCEGYAKAFGLLCSRTGIKCVLVTGESYEGENHAWNQVCVNGEWYNMDVTWDDTDVPGDMRRVYFLTNDQEFNITHKSDGELFAPFPCGDNDNNYYKINGQYAETLEQAREILFRELYNGSSTVEIKFASEQLYNEFMDVYVERQEVFPVLSEAGRLRENTSVSVRENAPERLITILISE